MGSKSVFKLRLALLGLLRQVQHETGNDALLTDILQRQGIEVSRGEVGRQLVQMSQLGLVTVAFPNGLCVASLTEYGGNVAQGIESCAGVKQSALAKRD